MRKDYETVIGLEVHAELLTKTKIFCSCRSEFGAKPNTNICPICMGMPGTLPVLNEKVVEYAVKAGLATNCKISKDSRNDRKNYFYPDLPKAYQISQYDKPLCVDGYLEIETSDIKKKIRIERIHIEEDAGKLIHSEEDGGTLVDLNRAGVPLIEIVSKPDLKSADEVNEYLKKLKQTLEYVGVSDCKMQEGSLRVDVNISVKKIENVELGTRTEIKNINSFKSITRAIEYETLRQIDILEKGGKVVKNTLRWDDTLGKTYAMRDKEDACDYRYFREPDLMGIKLSDEYIKNIRDNLPELPDARKERYIKEYNLQEKEAKDMTASKYISEFFEKAAQESNNPKAVCNWLISDISRILNENGQEYKDIPFSASYFAKLVVIIDKGIISQSIGKKVLEEMFINNKEPEEIVKNKGFLQISDEEEIRKVVNHVITNNAHSVLDYKNGKDRALGFLVGQAMKATKGMANPKLLNKILLEELKK